MTDLAAPGDDRRRLGAWGEQVAARRLLAQGCHIRERNWRWGARGEIDIIVDDGETIAFVEVRTRRGRAAGTPEESLTTRKKRKLRTLALAYLAAHDLDDVAWRIDLVAVEADGRGNVLRCRHYPNVVQDW